MNTLHAETEQLKQKHSLLPAAFTRPLAKLAVVAMLVGATGELAACSSDGAKSNDTNTTHVANSPKPRELIPEDPVVSPENGIIWAGYVAPRQDRATYTSVRGSFTVQAITCDSDDPTAASESYAQWVGLDGWGASTVEQIGITASCMDTSITTGVVDKNAPYKPGNLEPYYYAWWMDFGGGSYSSTLDEFPVHPGDRMDASVDYTGGDTFLMQLVNETTGKKYEKSTTCRVENGGGSCPRVFAEWIIERAGNSALSNFGVAGFDEATATTDEAGTGLRTAAALQAFPVDMVQGANTLTHTSGLSASGDAFNVTYLQHGLAGQ